MQLPFQVRPLLPKASPPQTHLSQSLFTVQQQDASNTAAFPENRTEPRLGLLDVASSNLRMQHRSAQPSPSALIPDFHTHQHAQ